MTERPLTQPFSWLGSKVRMRKNVLEILEPIPRKLYVEPFGGSGSIFFGKEPENSVYNDRERLLANFMRELRSEQSRHAMTLLASITPPCREFFNELKALCKTYSKGGDVAEQIASLKLKDYSIESAVAFAFLYVQSFSFGGKPLDVFCPDSIKSIKERGGKRNTMAYRSHVGLLERFAKQLEKTVVENKDWREIIAKYDDETSLFYCDPPYEVETAKAYPGAWTSDDTKELVRRLGEIQGSFVLSCYDGELYEPLLEVAERRAFKAFSSCCREIKGRCERTETVYIKNNAAKLARLF